MGQGVRLFFLEINVEFQRNSPGGQGEGRAGLDESQVGQRRLAAPQPLQHAGAGEACGAEEGGTAIACAWQRQGNRVCDKQPGRANSSRGRVQLPVRGAAQVQL